MKINFAALSDEDRKAEFAKMSNIDLDASLTEARTEGAALFALDEPTIAQVTEAEQVLASLGHIETEQGARAAAVADAAERFAKAKATFSAEPEETDEPEVEETDEPEAEETDEPEAEETDEPEVDAGEGDAAVTAAAVNHVTGQRISAAKAVGAKAKRPAVKATNDVVITAAADIPDFATGQRLTGMSEVALAVMNRMKGFPSYNKGAAEAAHSASGGKPVLHKFGAASFATAFDKSLVAGAGHESAHLTIKESVRQHVERVTTSLGHNGASPAAMAAAMAWCSPSEVVYNWIADYVVDGLLTVPQIAAPRGGLWLTKGPQLLQTEFGTPAAIDGFGFGGTEVEMEAGYIKTCETITCPEFEEYRLDFDGYCWKIPILTESTFPELVADVMRLSDVLYARKMNRRLINDILDFSTPVDATNALGGSQMDTLEAFTQVAIKERRWWNIGENAVMEIKFPQEALPIFQFDMARRSGLALNDVATTQKVAAHFAAHNFAVEYISDFDQRYGAATPTADWPETIRGIMYPAGAFVQSVKPVINLSAVYDAASLSENEYTGVFFEQGVMTIDRAYRSHVIEVPVCVAGRTGANDFTCEGFETPGFDGSF